MLINNGQWMTEKKPAQNSSSLAQLGASKKDKSFLLTTARLENQIQITTELI